MYEGHLVRITSDDANKGQDIIDRTTGKVFPLDHMIEAFVCFENPNISDDCNAIKRLKTGQMFIVVLPVKEKAPHIYCLKVGDVEHVISNHQFNRMTQNIPAHARDMVVP